MDFLIRLGSVKQQRERNVGGVDNRAATRDWRGGTLYCKGTNFYSRSRFVHFQGICFLPTNTIIKPPFRLQEAEPNNVA